MVITLNLNSFGQIIIDPINNPFFVIKRKTANIKLPKSLGGDKVRGFAGMSIILDSLGKIQSAEVLKLNLSGIVNTSYQKYEDLKSDTVVKYEHFFKNYAYSIKIIKVDKRKPPQNNKITFLFRF